MINCESVEGIKPMKIAGEIEFKKVYFNYPSRSDVPVLIDLSLKIEAGTTVALVGSSGECHRNDANENDANKSILTRLWKVDLHSTIATFL